MTSALCRACWRRPMYLLPTPVTTSSTIAVRTEQWLEVPRG